MHFELTSEKWQLFCLDLNVFSVHLVLDGRIKKMRHFPYVGRLCRTTNTSSTHCTDRSSLNQNWQLNIEARSRIYVSLKWKSLGQEMACRLFRGEALPEPVLIYCRPDSKNKFHEIQTKVQRFSFTNNAFENAICKMKVILWRPRYVKAWVIDHILIKG